MSLDILYIISQAIASTSLDLKTRKQYEETSYFPSIWLLLIIGLFAIAGLFHLEEMPLLGLLIWLGTFVYFVAGVIHSVVRIRNKHIRSKKAIKEVNQMFQALSNGNKEQAMELFEKNCSEKQK